MSRKKVRMNRMIGQYAFHGNPSGPFLENERKARKESSEKMAE